MKRLNNIIPGIYLFLPELDTTLLIFFLRLSSKEHANRSLLFWGFNAVTNMKDSLFAQFSS